MTYIFALATAWLAVHRQGGDTEFDVFTKTMLAFAILLALALAVAAYTNESVIRALAACEAVDEPLQDCMESKGYVPTEGDRSGASDGWQSEWAAGLFGDW